MRDVYYQQNRQGVWVFKALTDKARVEMKKMMEIPPRLDGEVFLYATPRDFTFVLTALNRAGLNTDEEEAPKKQIDVSAYTDF